MASTWKADAILKPKINLEPQGCSNILLLFQLENKKMKT